ncbi:MULTISPECIES: hypothetical protein [unclassified Sphingomonas]|uniref:hypothetical protein n=1 Tax=Sphingomonas TaxID=13687 RepID=UPI001ACE619F|nr:MULTISPECIES: hypothetical protein [unclassified Sphingomonas]MBN8811330.1 sel1 repeat family protein [Sphingomonas sp.]
MACKLCAWLCRWLGAGLADSFWKQSGDWERAHSNDYALWLEAPVETRERAEAALAIFDADPEAALRTFLDLAESGMPWAMEAVAGYYERGTVVAADFGQAQDQYRRAIEAGSWAATIGYAKLLARHGHFDTCDTLLRDCAEQDFVPACFWLAWYRLKRSRSAATCREVRPLLERAADAGHPAAGIVLARLKLLGKFGFREIPAGLRQLSRAMDRSRADASGRHIALEGRIPAAG